MHNQNHVVEATGITCDHCVRRIQAAFNAQDPQARVSVDKTSQQVTVSSQILSASDIQRILGDAGYAPRSTHTAD